MDKDKLFKSYLQIGTEEIDKIYNNSSEMERNSIFYCILNEYYEIKDTATNGQIAHLCHLMSYLIIKYIKPVNKDEISIVFAKKSYEYMKVEKYRAWLEFLIKNKDLEV